MKFIKLHDADDNKMIVLSADRVISVHKRGETTVIEVEGSDYEFEVNESVEKIFSMLDEGTDGSKK